MDNNKKTIINCLELEREINNMLSHKKDHSSYDYTDGLSNKVKKALVELDTNHNNSLAVELYRRNSSNMRNDALFYRGNKITYREMFSKVYEYAKSLSNMGYKKGDEVPVCVSNSPEFIYMFLASSLIGCKINSFGEWFDKDYLVSILNKSGSKNVFVSDDVYSMIKDSVDQSNIENIVLFSLCDSLPKDKNGNRVDPYEEIDSKFYKFENKVSLYREDSNKNVIDQAQFLEYGNDYDKFVVCDCGLDDDAVISYTSGTTNPGVPKAVLHGARSYLTLSRFKESDVSGMPTMKNLKVLAHIPTYTHMEMTCAISDTLYEKCALCLEPIYNKDFFPYSIVINKPNFVPAAVGFWMKLCKKLEYDKDFHNCSMSFLMIPTATGEGLSSGEEKYFNYIARKYKFGKDKLPAIMPHTYFSIGGGTSEGSGIFVTLFKSLFDKFSLSKDTLGLTPLKFASLQVLNEKGGYCNVGERGKLVGNSPCSMKRYYYTDENTYVVDRFGKWWLDYGTYAYKSDDKGRIKMTDRPCNCIINEDGSKVYYSEIENAIGKDTKNIMSCSVVKINDDNYVCHIEFQPNKKNNSDDILKGCAERVNLLNENITSKLYFRVRDINESFPCAPSGKRDKGALISEGINDKCIALNDYLVFKKNNNKTLKKSL